MRARWLPWAVVAVLLAVLGYAVAGPWLAIRGIEQAIRNDDTRALARQVDFPALRANLRAQAEDHIARQYGDRAQGSVFGRLGLRVASGLAGGVVDAMATPVGLAALMEGRRVWSRLDGSPPTRSLDGSQHPEPFRDARYRYESTSRFTVTIDDERGRPLVFVLTRKGLHWRLSDIRISP
ncbi:DUF2939 domain-containing protein [Luteimonas yindakuii]|uniref:DUF2939 domain-containing protein n=2 Tax=Luteimonas yindakuii TaxID=2565782 RepID=A0A4Z1R9I9_9GAMM|nr:DUF2939 domain-containing protein [Luteimonas yindakuii]